MVSTGGVRRNRRNIIGLVAAQGRMLRIDWHVWLAA
jgi:hypothetical protein